MTICFAGLQHVVDATAAVYVECGLVDCTVEGLSRKKKAKAKAE